MVGLTQRRKKKGAPIPEAVKLLRARLIKYQQCRDAKCTPEWIMNKELKNYSKSRNASVVYYPKI